MRDRLLIQLDVGPSGASLRVGLGLAFALAARRGLPGSGLVAGSAALAAVLFGLKVAAVVGRRLARPGPAVTAAWEWRRQLARAHDSYQVRKLLWIGVGILSARWVAGPGPAWEASLGGICAVSGALAALWWRRKGLPVTPAERT